MQCKRSRLYTMPLGTMFRYQCLVHVSDRSIFYYQSKTYCPVLVAQEGSTLWGSILITALLHDQNRTIPYGLLVPILCYCEALFFRWSRISVGSSACSCGGEIAIIYVVLSWPIAAFRSPAQRGLIQSCLPKLCIAKKPTKNEHCFFFTR